MRSRKIVLKRQAQADLRQIRIWITYRVSAAFARDYLGRVRDRLAQMDVGSERGTVHDDVRPDVRVIGLMRSIGVAFRVTETQVVILRVFYGGQDWRSALGADLEAGD